MARPLACRVEGRVLGLACFPTVAVDANPHLAQTPSRGQYEEL